MSKDKSKYAENKESAVISTQEVIKVKLNELELTNEKSNVVALYS